MAIAVRTKTLLLPAIIGLSACASAPRPEAVGRVGHADVSALLSTAETRLTLESNKTFLMPLEDLGNAMPVYPAHRLSTALPPRTVCLNVDIDENGGVASATPTEGGTTCPGGAEPDFVEAARVAVLTWRFEPALRCVFPDAATRGRANQTCEGGKAHPQAVRLAYRFVFEALDGCGVVRTGP